LLPPAALDYLRGLGVRLVQVVRAGVATEPSGDQVADLDGVYLPWLAGLRAAAALVRPDFYLFGAAPDGAALAAVVADLRGRLGAPAGPPRPAAVQPNRVPSSRR
jgi:flavoprotein hydroxylase